MIDLRYVKKIVELLDGSSVDSIEISTDKGMKLRISKTPQQRGAMVTPAVSIPAIVPQAVTSSRLTPSEGVPLAADDDGQTRAEAPKAKLLEVKSPMVGTFYRSPEPGIPPYVAEGTRVEKGQILCIIEAMKIMNEIETDAAGTIREILCENGQAVEFGQPLFIVE
jgi:acetyl-CoA carboxylase biotin carboxyl carrier protein